MATIKLSTIARILAFLGTFFYVLTSPIRWCSNLVKGNLGTIVWTWFTVYTVVSVFGFYHLSLDEMSWRQILTALYVILTVGGFIIVCIFDGFHPLGVVFEAHAEVLHAIFGPIVEILVQPREYFSHLAKNVRWASLLKGFGLKVVDDVSKPIPESPPQPTSKASSNHEH